MMTCTPMNYNTNVVYTIVGEKNLTMIRNKKIKVTNVVVAIYRLAINVIYQSAVSLNVCSFSYAFAF